MSRVLPELATCFQERRDRLRPQNVDVALELASADVGAYGKATAYFVKCGTIRALAFQHIKKYNLGEVGFRIFSVAVVRKTWKTFYIRKTYA
jgi:hypothetical protein